jgi:hypothetical protein
VNANDASKFARVYDDVSQFHKTEALETWVAETRKRVLREDDPSTLESIRYLTATYLLYGRQHESEVMLVQALDAQRRVPGRSHPSTLATMHGLGQANSQLGRTEEAEQL